MKASDVMTRSVITISAQASSADALRMMLGKAISGLPVVDDKGHLVAVLSG